MSDRYNATLVYRLINGYQKPPKRTGREHELFQRRATSISRKADIKEKMLHANIHIELATAALNRKIIKNQVGMGQGNTSIGKSRARPLDMDKSIDMDPYRNTKPRWWQDEEPPEDILPPSKLWQREFRLRDNEGFRAWLEEETEHMDESIVEELYIDPSMGNYRKP